MLELRQLTVLQAIARAGSLAGAARVLHHSQPTVAHHLAALESHLGVDLVNRTTRGATLTDLGQLFLSHAEAVLDRLGSAEAEVKALARHGVATLRIGTFPTAGAHVLPRAVAALEVRTGVRVELHEAEPPEPDRPAARARAALRAHLRRPGRPGPRARGRRSHAAVRRPLPRRAPGVAPTGRT